MNSLLLSDDGSAMAVWVTFDTGEVSDEFDRAIVSGIEEILQPVRHHFEHAFHVSPSVLRQSVGDKIVGDQLHILPWMVAVLLMTLALTLRRAHGALLPFLTAGISIVWILGLMAVLGVPVNVMTSIVPALLLIIGSTEDIHLLAEYYNGRSLGLGREAAIERMNRHMGTAILLTAVTTYVGFLSISVNDIDLLREFGLVASSGILFNFLATALLVPAWLRSFFCPRWNRSTSRWGRPLHPWARSYHPILTQNGSMQDVVKNEPHRSCLARCGSQARRILRSTP